MKSIRPLVSQKAKKRNFWRRSWPWLVLIALLAGGGAGWYFLAGPGSQKARFTAMAQGGSVLLTTTVQRGDIQVAATGSGTLEAGQEVDLSFSTSGTVAELNVKVGDQVEVGEVLARLGNAEDLEANLATAQLDLLEAQQSLKGLQTNASVSMAQAYQAWVAAQGTYKTALTTSQRTDYARCSQEVTTKYAEALSRAKQKLTNINAEKTGSEAWIGAKNDLDTAQANYDYCIAHTDDEKVTAQSDLEVARIALQKAEEKYITLSENSGIDPDELALAEAKGKAAESKLTIAQNELDGTVLTAPIAGKVISIASEAGTRVDTSSYITIADLSQPKLTVSIDEADMVKFGVGNPVTIVFDALPDQTFLGKVVEINPSLVSSGFYSVVQGVVELDDTAVETVSKLPLGLTATATIISQEAKDTLVVPLTALKALDDGYSVMVVGSDGKETQQVVTIGLEDTENVQILSGLAEGDLINSGVSALSSSSFEFPGDMMMPGGMPAGGGMPGGGGPP